MKNYISIILGMGTSVEIQSYSFEDRQPTPGSNYYRLQQMDYDGSFEYSSVEHLFYKTDQLFTLDIFPNPNRGSFVVNLFNPHKQATIITIYDQLGRVVWNQQFEEGELHEYWEQHFNLPQNQIYFLATQVGTKLETAKIVVLD